MTINDALRSHAEQEAAYRKGAHDLPPGVRAGVIGHDSQGTEKNGYGCDECEAVAEEADDVEHEGYCRYAEKPEIVRDGTEWPARPPDTSHYESYQSFKHRDFKYRERHGRAPSVSPDLMVPNMMALYRAPDLDGPPRILPEPGTLTVRAFDRHHADPAACTRCSAVTFRKGGLCDRCAK